jgi:hypothetical protein
MQSNPDCRLKLFVRVRYLLFTSHAKIFLLAGFFLPFSPFGCKLLSPKMPQKYHQLLEYCRNISQYFALTSVDKWFIPMSPNKTILKTGARIIHRKGFYLGGDFPRQGRDLRPAQGF